MSVNGDYSNPMFTRYLGPETGRNTYPEEDVSAEKTMGLGSSVSTNKSVDFVDQAPPKRTQTYDSNSNVGTPAQPATTGISLEMLFDLFKTLLSMLSGPKEADRFEQEPDQAAQSSEPNIHQSPEKIQVTTTMAVGEGDSAPIRSLRPDSSNDSSGDSDKVIIRTTMAMGEGDSAPIRSLRPDRSDDSSGDSDKVIISTTMAMGEGDTAPVWASKSEPSESASGDSEGKFSSIAGGASTLAVGENDR